MDDTTFAVVVRVVNEALARRSGRHGGAPCPAGLPAVRRGVLGACDLGCFDEAVPLLEGVLARLAGRDPAGSPGVAATRDEARAGVPSAYVARAARSALGDLSRERRRRLGLPQRPERIPDMGWARRALPAPADRALLSHLLTWLGSDAQALAGAGWPLRAWAERYGTSPRAMAAWIERVLATVAAASPDRYQRYLSRPLAEKRPVVAPFSATETIDGLPVHGRGPRYRGAEPLWPAGGGPDPAVDRQVARYRVDGLAATVAARHGAGPPAIRAFRTALVEAFGPGAITASEEDLAVILRRTIGLAEPPPAAGPALGAALVLAA